MINGTKMALLFGAQKPTLDLNFAERSGYIKGVGPGPITSLVTNTGGVGGMVVNSAGVLVADSGQLAAYDPVTRACLGAPIWQEFPNLFTYSEQFDNAAWDGGAGGPAGVTANTSTAPDGALTADTLNDDSAGAVLGRAQTASIVSGSGMYTGSVFIKAGTSSVASARLYVAGVSTVTGEAVINLATGDVQWRSGTVGTALAVTNMGGGVYRLIPTITDNASGNNTVVLEIRPAFAATYSATLNTAATGTVIVWGAQVVAGGIPGPYIPSTTPEASRTADNVAFTWTQPDGAYAVEFSLASVSGTRPVLSLDDGTADNQIRLYASGTSLKLTVTTGGVTQADLTLGTVAANTTYKAAFSIRANEFLALMNGGTLQSDTAGTVPVVTTGRIGSDVAGNYQNGHNKRTRAWRQFKSNLYPLVS